MTKKDKIDQTGFQLDPKQFKTGNFMIDGFLKGFVEDLNETDLNKDGVSDVAQFASIGVRLLPSLAALDAAVDFEAAGVYFASLPFVKDKQNMANFLRELGHAAEKAGKLFPDKVAGK